MKIKFIINSCMAGIILTCKVFSVQAQDTIRIKLPEAENQFFQKNLQLLSEKYNIDIAKAQVIQARLFDNPTLQLSGNLYDPKQRSFFNVSNSTGQYDVAIQQLVRLAGKRNKEVKLAETSTTLSENKFSELLRTLQYSLRSSFYNLFYLQHSINAYQRQVVSLEKLNTAYESLQAKAVVTLKDALRIRSLLYSLKSEQVALQNQVNEQQAEIQLLLQSNHAYFIAVADTNILSSSMVDRLKLDALIDTAYTYRTDLHFAENTIKYNQQNLLLQKALAKPDLTLGAEFDKRGSFVDNASFLTVAIDLPLFKRNQGNIRAARFEIEQSKLVADQQKQSIANEVQAAYSKLLNTDRMLRSIDPAFVSQFEHLLQAVTENFEKKNISLIEFSDFYESYKNNILQLNQIQNDRIQALEALQFAVGKKLFNL